MNTNFFNQIAALNYTGVLQLNISKGIDTNLIVTVLLHNEQCGDNAKNLIPPLAFNATPQEFDEGFIQQITSPVQKVSGLMLDLESYLKQLEEVKKQSAMGKEKAEGAKKEKEAKDKKFKEAMAKADELEKQGKFRDAWMKVPDMAEFPEKADELRKRKSALSSKFAPDLFGETAIAEEPKWSDSANDEDSGEFDAENYGLDDSEQDNEND